MDRLTSMRVFLRVIDEGSFAAAARVLDMSPAVVTRLVADLEEHLGTRLLHRTTRKQSLTEAGDTYVERVRLILQDLDETHAMVSSQTQELSGVLRISATPSIATNILAPLLAGFRSTYPCILLDIDVGNNGQATIEDFDVTLLGVNQNFDGNIVARKVIESEGILVASPDYLTRKGAPKTIENLVDHDCLRVVPDGSRNRAWRLFRSDDDAQVVELDVKPVLWANHVDTLMRSAKDGAGITVAPIELAAPHITSGALVRVLSPWITNRYVLYAALPSRKFLPQRTHVFVDYLCEKTRTNVARAMQVCVAC